jgi:hypothetical protein
MVGSWPPDDFPHLTAENFVETSPRTDRYNCIAWAASDETRWWWPDALEIYYWPIGIPRENTLEAFVAAYSRLGYDLCEDGSLEEGFTKLALYAGLHIGSNAITHAARQLPNGKWTSKLGSCEDIEHTTVEALDGPSYGRAICFLKRS